VLLVLTARAIGATEVFHTAAQQASSPKYVTLPDGHVGGICVDLFRLMEAREPALRIEGDQRFLPLRRLEKKVQHGQLDFICGVGESPARRDHFIVLTPAIFTVRYHLAVRRDDPVEIRSWQDVRALGQGASSSSTMAAAPSPGSRTSAASSSTAAGSATRPTTRSC